MVNLMEEAEAFAVSVKFKGFANVLERVLDGESVDEGLAGAHVSRDDLKWFSDLVGMVDWDGLHYHCNPKLSTLACSLRPCFFSSFGRRGYDRDFYEKVYDSFSNGIGLSGLNQKETKDLQEVLEDISGDILTSLVVNHNSYAFYATRHAPFG